MLFDGQKCTLFGFVCRLVLDFDAYMMYSGSGGGDGLAR